MAKQITKFGWFTVPEWEKEEAWLREQHKKGWKLINVTFPGFYRFEACTPEDVVYQLDYNQEGRSHKGEYLTMFADCGWEYIADMAGYSYFRKPVSQMNEEEEIFSDEDSKMEMIHRVYKGRVKLLIILFLCVILPQFIMAERWLNEGPMGVGIFIMIFAVFVMYVCLFIQFARKYKQTKESSER